MGDFGGAVRFSRWLLSENCDIHICDCPGLSEFKSENCPPHRPTHPWPTVFRILEGTKEKFSGRSGKLFQIMSTLRQRRDALIGPNLLFVRQQKPRLRYFLRLSLSSLDTWPSTPGICCNQLETLLKILTSHRHAQG